MRVNLIVKPGDKVQIGGQIEIVILEVGQAQVRFLLELPPHTPVLKQENYHLLQIENRRSASTSERKVKQMVELFKAEKEGQGIDS